MPPSGGRARRPGSPRRSPPRSGTRPGCRARRRRAGRGAPPGPGAAGPRRRPGGPGAGRQRSRPAAPAAMAVAGRASRPAMRSRASRRRAGRHRADGRAARGEVGDGPPGEVDQGEAGAEEQGVAGRHVVAHERLERDGAGRLAAGHQRQPVGDGGAGAEAGRREERGVGERVVLGRHGETSTTSLPARPCSRAATRHRRAVAPDRAGPLGPGEELLAAVRGGVGQHHAQHRVAVAQQADGDRGAAPPVAEGAGAVVRVDDPGVRDSSSAGARSWAGSSSATKP